MPFPLRISRPRLLLVESPLSFLYQTSTILRHAYASDAFGEIDTLELKRQARHKISADWSKVNRSPTRARRSIKPIQSRPRNSLESRAPSRRFDPSSAPASPPQEREWIDHVPFEGVADRPATILDRLQGQTITRHEFNVFKDILAQGASAENAAKEAAIKRKRRRDSTGRARGLVREEVEMPVVLKPLAEEAANISAENMREKEEELVMQEERRMKKYREEIQKLMDEKKTDVELWGVWEGRLKEDVLAVLEGKNDGEKNKEEDGGKNDQGKNDQGKTEKEGKGDTVNLSTLTTTLPQLLLHLSSLLRNSFPASPLPLSLLPSLRQLGPRAFAMGATTHLFNSHMRCLWERYTDLESIVACLAEMDRDVYEFDQGTHQLLEEIFQRAEVVAKQGGGGGAVAAFWATERKLRGLEKLEEWEKVVAERIGKLEARRKEWNREIGGEGEVEVERVRGMSVGD